MVKHSETSALRTPALSRADLDPVAHRRTDDAWLKAAWSDPRTRVLLLEAGDPGTHGWQALHSRPSLARVTDDGDRPRLVFVAPEEAPAGEWYLLGVDDEERAYFAVRLTGESTQHPAATLPNTRGASLRADGPLLDERDSGLLTQAVALGNWHATHPCCPRCGASTRSRSAGHVRVCLAEGREHFPRLDPAVIMLVHDDDPDGIERCLLAHNPQWPGNRFSVLAGYVEPGESLEQAVVREVAEEVGVTVTQPQYVASQPWPFPRSLMFGFTAQAVGATPRTDEAEIERVRWMSRPELAAAAASGEVVLPGRVSIARGLIEHWFGGELPGQW